MKPEIENEVKQGGGVVCQQEPCSGSWFMNGAEYRERDGWIEARNHLNPEWVTVDKSENTHEQMSDIIDPPVALHRLVRRYHLQLISYRLAAWLIGGTVHQFEGRDRAGRWHCGLCLLSHDALVAHKVCFRHDANVYTDTALVEPNALAMASADKYKLY